MDEDADWDSETEGQMGYTSAGVLGEEWEFYGDFVVANNRSFRLLGAGVLELNEVKFFEVSMDWGDVALDEVKADGHISLADAHAVALAHERDATLVVGADDDFDDLTLDVDLFAFRDHGV